MSARLDWNSGVLTQHLAIVGKTGSGKTYTAKGLVEGLLEAGRRVCVLDPTGAWWGLRSSADGRKPGHPVTVFGGEHADVPIMEHGAAALGELLGREHVPAIIDLEGLWLSQRHRFIERFAESIYRSNRSPLHLVIDEADEFAPQKPLPETQRMLGAVDRIVRRGRSKGFRVMLISQRPAVLHKNVLTQCNTLIAMRLPSPQDRAAVQDWIKGQADAEQGRDVLSTLARLQKGEGWVWAPEYDVLARTTFPRIKTFDSSRTPTDGEAIQPPKALAQVDLARIREAMEDAIREAEANDPELLRRRIKELEARLAAPAHDPADVERAAHALARRSLQATAGKARELAKIAVFAAGAARGLQKHAEDLRDGLGDLAADAEAGPPLTDGKKSGVVYSFATAPAATVESKPHRQPGGRHAAAPAAGITGPQQRVLDAIAWWQAVGRAEPTLAQVGFVAGIRPGGGHFNNTVGPLVTGGLVTRERGIVGLTPAGAQLATRPDRPATLQAYHEMILRLLRTGPQRRVLETIMAAGGRPVTPEEIQKATGITPGGGHYNNTVGPLVTLGLIERAAGELRPTALLFPDWLGG
ncbi:MAG: DUF853 family protein [Phycisphaeraceae bacterium]|nr:DUF853 family protein [Phycisphaeraceae bacterium]